MHQDHGSKVGDTKVWPPEGWLCKRLPGGVLLGSLTLAKTASAARGTAFRGQWSLGSLIGSLAILGVLVALVLFLVWPRRRGD